MLSTQPHSFLQLIYDYVDGGYSIGLVSLQPDQLPPDERKEFMKIGVNIPSVS